ncbi:MAG: radical SAM protein [Deltaproteobacteria bacterium]|uniref:Radical SAM protein n=1 Tax=Candidatus Zymogenus saltonus TaxID=2844893 RepID=A0A9D8KE01_9DELT|nr:radical SAM protein [Candidatus Zymogenus saltonus]
MREEKNFKPSYISLCESGLLKERVERLHGFLEGCALCPRKCGVDRTIGEKGYCGAGELLMVSSAFAHFGEEPPLVGVYGSGTIFLTHCNLKCVFCQNYDISHEARGEVISTEELAKQMIALQAKGTHNINFVTPTHYVPQIVEALPRAVEMGLEVPLVFNCGGYESIEVIRLLEGIFDIYMPDYKFTDSDSARRYLDAPDYPDVAKSVLKEMHRQVGVLKVDFRGIATKGLLIRHLVMPGGADESKRAFEFIAEELSNDSYVNIMEQYRPEYRACEFAEIARTITGNEYMEAVKLARGAGLSRGF